MKLHEITEGVLQPDEVQMELLSDALDLVNSDYEAHLSDNNDEDDPDHLAWIMDETFEEMGMSITVELGEPGANGVDWYIQSAIVYGGGEIDLILHYDTVTGGYWGPASFKKSVMKTLEHEHIHLSQRDRMGKKKYNSLPSGYQIGLRKQEKSGKESDLIRTYLRDPQELMAHGHDLAREVQSSSNPVEAIRNPEKYREELPTYDKHRATFPPNAKPLQRLISYATKYLQHYA